MGTSLCDLLNVFVGPTCILIIDKLPRPTPPGWRHSILLMSLCHGKYVNIISLICIICMYYMFPLPQNEAVNKIELN